jgi:hypothetical protein
MSDRAFIVYAHLHGDDGLAQVAKFLIRQAQIPTGAGLTRPVAAGPHKAQVLFIIVGRLARISKVGVRQANIAQNRPFGGLVAHLASNVQGGLIAHNGAAGLSEMAIGGAEFGQVGGFGLQIALCWLPPLIHRLFWPTPA